MGSVYILSKEKMKWYFSQYFKDEEEKHTLVKAHPVIHWSIIILSSQNLLFYIYWSPLYTYIEKIFN